MVLTAHQCFGYSASYCKWLQVHLAHAGRAAIVEMDVLHTSCRDGLFKTKSAMRLTSES